MLFKRRKPPGWGETVRVALWPRRSWSRSVQYMMQRVWRLQGTPEFIALGCVCGMFASFTPFVGFHFVVAGVLAYVFRASILASAIGTFVGNPLTFPFIWYGTYAVGNFILGGSGDFSIGELQAGFGAMMTGILTFSSSAFTAAVDTIWPLVKPMLVGAPILGLPFCGVSYFVIKRMVIAYQAKRRELRNLERAEMTTGS
ncbi:MAG: DUF2062 domain-containing protein [Pseudomonadota bacterium]